MGGWVSEENEINAMSAINWVVVEVEGELGNKWIKKNLDLD